VDRQDGALTVILNCADTASPARTPYPPLSSAAENSMTNKAVGGTYSHVLAIQVVAAAILRRPKQKRQSGSDSERAVQRNHSVGCAAIFVEADVGAIEVEVAIWLIAGLRIDG
jgi:hypothetical protein